MTHPQRTRIYMSALRAFDRVRVAIFLLPIIAGVFAIPSGAQQAATTESHASSPDAIGPDDLIDLTVAYCPELTHNFRVSSDGKLVLPLLHKPLDVAGTTPSELSLRIEAALKDAHVLVDPVVSVSVLESRSRPVSVVGAVNHPLTFQATTHTTLIDAIARAQGISPTAGGTIVLTSPGSGDSSTVREIPVATLLDGKAPRDNVSLRGGEEIRVLEGNKIFVAGDVRRPGMYPMQSDSDTTVVKALALSSGLDQYSAKIAYIYRRNGADKQREEIQVPLKAILKRRAPDVELKADDILYVPTNNGERITGKLLSQLAGFGQTAEAGLLVIH